MKKKINKKRTDEPSGKLKTIDDFLPPPHKLTSPSKSLKITITLDTDTVDFFKDQAEENDAKYQVMMREVLKMYARRFSKG